MGATGTNIGYNKNTMENIERIRETGEQQRILAESRQEQALGNRSWNPTVGQTIYNVGYDRAQLEIFNAPVGTVISMYSQEGDYKGDYTRTANGWNGSQRYKSAYTKPNDVTKPEVFARNLVGSQIKVVKVK